MDHLLQEHGAKHVYRVPEGFRELCDDISREVLRTQPEDIYCYIADYIDALLITRENAKLAVRVVNNILNGSQAIVGILHGTGLSLGQIAVAAPKLQKAFRIYLDAVDIQPVQPCENDVYDAQSCTSIRNILEATGATLEKAERAATMIQTAFRGHYEIMVEREAKGEIQWERAASNTMKILKKAGVSQAEATNASTLIQSAYRGYYTRRNKTMDIDDKEHNPAHDLPSSQQTIQAVAWLDMMYEDSGLTAKRANEAATLIQNRVKHSNAVIFSQSLGACRKIPTERINRSWILTSHFIQNPHNSGLSSAYRGFKTRRRRRHDVERTSSANSLVVDAIVENVRQKIFEKVLSRQDIPRELGNQGDVEVVAEKIENAYKERLRESRLSSETDTDKIYESESEISEGDDADVDPQENPDQNNEIQVSDETIDVTRTPSPTDMTTHSHH